jgi:hypothetical protein
MNKSPIIILLITLLTFGSCGNTAIRDQGISRSHIPEIEDIEFAMANIVRELMDAGVLSRESTVALGTRVTEFAGIHNMSATPMESNGMRELFSNYLMIDLVKYAMCTVIRNATESDYGIKLIISDGMPRVSNEGSMLGTNTHDSRWNVSLQLWKLTSDTPELVFATSQIIQKTTH